jgi:hypothetical protein
MGVTQFYEIQHNESMSQNEVFPKLKTVIDGDNLTKYRPSTENGIWFRTLKLSNEVGISSGVTGFYDIQHNRALQAKINVSSNWKWIDGE